MNNPESRAGEQWEPEGLLKVSAAIDRFLEMVARVAAWFGVIIVFTVVYDVVTRYFGVPRGFGINATELQESEYWMHTILFSFVIGYAYTRQSHVRIDLVRERLPQKYKFLIEMIGCAFFVLPYCVIATYYLSIYTYASFESGEFSKSVIGLRNIWILKSFLVCLFILLACAGVSQLIKSTYGFLGRLPDDLAKKTVGGDL